jgi:hypothetical protein
LWQSARRSMFFCTAPDAGRFVDQIGAITFTSHPHKTSGDASFGGPWSLVISDLVQPGRFRSFLHFVASGQSDLRLTRVFAEFYQLMSRSDEAALSEGEALLSEVAPEPTALRRLKRRLLGFEGRSPRWRLDPERVLAALATGPLGEMVAADDAALDEWLQLSWDRNPSTTLDLLSMARDHGGDSGFDQAARGAKNPTARAGLAISLSSKVDSLLSPGTLAPVAAAAPGEAMVSVWNRASVGLWHAWAALPKTQRAELLRVSPRPGGTDSAVAAKALLDEPEALAQLIGAYPDVLDAAIGAAAQASVPVRLDNASLSGAARRQIRQELATESEPSRLRVLAQLADPGDLPGSLNYAAWDELLRKEATIPAAVVYLVGRKSRSATGLRSAALAVAVLYRAFSREREADAWPYLAPRLKSGASSRDRGRRLTDDFANCLAKVDDRVLNATIEFMRDEDLLSATAVARALNERRKPRNVWDLFNPLRW